MEVLVNTSASAFTQSSIVSQEWTTATSTMSESADIVTEFGFTIATELDFMNATTGNFTTASSLPLYKQVLKVLQKWMLTWALVWIMLSMGAVITVNDFRQTFRHPVGFVIGFLSQFVTMPLFCFLTALVLRLDTPFALGLLIIGCCPGGTVSNLFTFWTDGDVCLSVCMTSVSCVAAIGMMPLNLLIYSRRWTSEQTKVPFMNIFTTLLTIVIPAAAGMVVRRFSLKWAERVSKIGSIMGLATIPFSITIIGIINPGMFSSSWKLWTSTAGLPFVGYAFGYGVGMICRQPRFKCRTIGFETGIQNSALAITIMLLTFGDSDLLYDMMTVPSLYGILSFLDFLIYVAFFRIRVYYRNRNAPEQIAADDDCLDAEESIKKEKAFAEESYHSNSISTNPNNKYLPIKTLEDGDIIILKTMDEKNIEVETGPTMNGDYQQLGSEDDVMMTSYDRELNETVNPLDDTEVLMDKSSDERVNKTISHA